MVAEGYITQEQADEAGAVPWVWEPAAADGTPQTMTVLPRSTDTSDLGEVRYAEDGSEYWVDLVRRQLRERFGPGAETQGLRVYTTYDPEMQAQAYDAVTQNLNRADGPVGSLVAVDAEGQVRAMVGGTDFANNKVNLALGKEGGGSGRQPGSTFKPFALAAFVEEGYSTESLFRSPPTTQFPGVFTEPGKLWSPRNFNKADQGVLTVEEATWKSSNTVYAGIVNLVTPQKLAEMAQPARRHRGAARRLLARARHRRGVGARHGLGVLDVRRPWRAHRPLRHPPGRERRRRGPLRRRRPTSRASRSSATEVADTVNSVLSGVLVKGTGKGANIGVVAAGKTGTTTDSKDAWFAGYTCHLTAAVWMGYEQPKADGDLPGRGGVGRHLAGDDLGGLHVRGDRGRRRSASSRPPTPASAWSTSRCRASARRPPIPRSGAPRPPPPPTGSSTSVPRSTTTTQAPTTTAAPTTAVADDRCAAPRRRPPPAPRPGPARPGPALRPFLRVGRCRTVRGDGRQPQGAGPDKEASHGCTHPDDGSHRDSTQGP